MANAAIKVFMAGVLTALAVPGRGALRCEPDGVRTAMVYLTEKVNLKLSTRERAIYVATRAFQDTGVHLDWQEGPITAARKSSGCALDEIIEVQVDASADKAFGRDAMAYSIPMQTVGIRVHVFYDRVSAILGNVPNLLGYVLAHEIGHVLEGAPRHSSQGILKANWNGRDYGSMSVLELRFTREDEEMMAARASVVGQGR
jgi:hypothetical protein